LGGKFKDLRCAAMRGIQGLGLACVAITLGCHATADAPDVVFGSAAPVGRWGKDDATATAGAGAPGGRSAMTAGSTAVASAGTASTSGVAPPEAGSLGSAGMTAVAGRGVAGAAAGSGGQAGSAADSGSGGTAGSAPANSLASLAFDVTTSPVGGRYQPKNIGAIWVQDKNGKLVKSLAVWAGIRRRYLTHYTSALAGSAVDVTASATLPSHRAHHVTWDLTARGGGSVAPGSYTLVMELTDGDMTGRWNMVAFDTTAGAQTLSPAAAPSFSSMTLQLQ
jgi:hypothetical protein